MNEQPSNKQNEMAYAAIVTADEMQVRDAWLAPVLQCLRQPPVSGRRAAAIDVVKQGWGSLQAKVLRYHSKLLKGVCHEQEQYANTTAFAGQRTEGNPGNACRDIRSAR